MLSASYGLAAATLSFWIGNLDLLNQSYNALTESVYQSLALQTRLKPYLDTITINVDNTGTHLDFTAMTARLTADKQTNAANAYTNLLELQKYAGNSLNPDGWDGLNTIAAWTGTLQSSLDVTRLLQEVGYNTTITGNDSLDGGTGNDYLKAAQIQIPTALAEDQARTVINNYDTGTGETDMIEFAVDVVPSDAFCFIQLNSAHDQIKQRKRVASHFSKQRKRVASHFSVTKNPRQLNQSNQSGDCYERDRLLSNRSR